ncbi:AlwI family type II restriction endonuclease [Campylobacter taeniopygiae]|uniref:AlwI family type II restriction endonuclease n=1 Tax=Campylobacter taeniopygiae TaxID=2510188 RepID=A0ABY2TIP0_9BACT|nr:AlwI family type II restriction endonuclease [Campylobacter taeniopygiae]TKX33976.1 AlwI family type II restriction endonuclease [Campylobacter taeniopygiae]
MKYDYFGNTSLRVKHLLLNFETQLLLFEELFKNADKKETWENNSTLQIKYLEALQNHNLLENKNKTTHLGTKDARVKSAPLEDFGLIKRKEKLISEQGYELLELIKNQAYKIDNDFLQIDLISMFFLKMSLKFSKSENLLQKYLEVFALYNGSISKELFLFLPLINNFKNTKEFIELFDKNQILDFLIFKDYRDKLEQFLIDLENKNYDKMNYFHTAKGEQSAKDILFALKLFLEFRENKDKNIFLELLKAKKDEKFYRFKELYLSYISKEINKENKIKDLIHFCELDSLQDFGKRFFKLIFKARIMNNLKDYADLNERYLNLCGIFEFNLESISINEIFKLVLKHSKYKDILKIITHSKISKELLSEYFNDKEFKVFFKNYEINSLKELKTYTKKENLKKIHKLLKYNFTKEKIINILELFENRKNDDKIASLVTKEATIPTIFEYIIAISWCYIDDFNLEHILNAGLSLDNKFLPKSHAVGGEADFIYHYNKHSLMIEATLTQKTNQRRAEMESVSRHLGNLLLNLEQEKREKSFAIFIAPYLDKNVLNDFRSRIYCYFENETNFIKGMKILPLSIKDLKNILNSNLNYKELLPKIYEILDDKDDYGSRWYKENIIKITQKA